MRNDLEDMALTLKALGHPVRLRIVAGLASGSACVKDIWECLDMPQAVISQHLRLLKKHGILLAHRDGNKVHYSLCEGKLAELFKGLGIGG